MELALNLFHLRLVMSLRKIKDFFSAQSMLAASMRQQVFSDPITDLGNRRYFDTRLQYCLDNMEADETGVFLLIEIYRFRSLQENIALSILDEHLRAIANRLRNATTGAMDPVLAYLGGGQFIVMVGKDRLDWAENILRRFLEEIAHYSKVQKLPAKIISAGIARFRKTDSQSNIIKYAQRALKEARGSPKNAWFYYERNDISEFDHEHLPSIFETALQQQAFSFTHHKRLPFEGLQKGYILYEPVWRRSNREDMAGKTFYALADKVGLTSRLVKMFIEQLINSLDTKILDFSKIGFTLPASVLHDPVFVSEINLLLGDKPDIAVRLVFEIPEHVAHKNAEEVQKVVKVLKQMGASIAITEFGRHFTAFEFLETLKVDYVLLDGMLFEKTDLSHQQFYLHALIEIAHNVSVVVVLEEQSVEEAKPWLQNIAMGNLANVSPTPYGALK